MRATYPEFLVARVIGPKKSVLVEVRRTILKKSTDWVLINSVVHYTPAGIAGVCRAMELEHDLIIEELKKNLAPSEPATAVPPAESTPPPAPDSGGDEKKLPDPSPIATTPPAPAAAPRGPAAEVDIVVTGRSPNPLIVFGRLDCVPVKVRVRDNANFIPGLVLRAKHSSDGPFLMVGNPPRWKGDRIGFTRPPQKEIAAS